LKIRIGHSYGQPAGDRAQAGAFYEMVDGLEKLDFDSLWLSDRIGADSIDPHLGLAAAAARTRRIKLGTSVTVLPGRNPYQLAKELVSLDQLSGGRALPVFGLGRFDPPEREALGVGSGERVPWLEEGLPLLRRLWRETSVTHEGPRFPVTGFTLRPRPLRRRLDIWLGGASPPELARCGRLGDGWLASFLTPEEAAARKAKVEAAADSAGREIEADHFGVIVPYSLRPLSPDELAQYEVRRAQLKLDGDIGRLVPQSGDLLVAQLEAFMEHGFSKFVLRPAVPPASWEEELREVAGVVLHLQTPN
jgi:probable F420-dependent oxidoreductase